MTTTVTGGELSMTSSNEYNFAGQKTQSTDFIGLTTTFSYLPGNNIGSNLKGVTVTESRGVQNVITERYCDNQTSSTTGNAKVAQYLNYGINADGGQWLKYSIGSGDSVRWILWQTDMAGRSLFTKKSGFQGTEIGDQSFYNDKNQLIKIATTDKPATLFIYDDLSNQIMQGLDIDQDGQLSPASDDMILQMESKYLKAGNTWVWQNQKNTYGTSNSDIVTLLNTTQDILTLGTGELSKQLDIDINGNTTTVATTVNRAQKLVTVSTTSPESSVAVQNVLQNGLSISERTSSNLTYTFNYDGLQRLTGITDPRIGTTAVAYHTTPGKFGLKASVTDPAGNIITYDYNGLGQLIEIKNALEQYSRYAYNTRGQLTKIWGARYPITLEYDNFGQQTKLTTYRNTTADFFGTGFPTVTGDVTTWVYDNASGLVMQKLDAENLATIYTYTATGNLASRTWARGITTNYTYNELDKLLTIDYSDETPDISYTYTRLRQLAGVTDAAGTRTFAYNDQFSLTNETINGIYNKELHARIRPAV